MVELFDFRQLSALFGLDWSIADFVLRQCLHWLSHLGHMSSEHLPKQLLFGELLKRRPFHGAKK